MFRVVLVFILIGFLNASFAAPVNADVPKARKYKLERKIKSLFRKKTSQHNKAVAVALDVSMGFLGVHRLYLGTSTKVPVVYMLTLGGGGFLVIADLVIILTAKDLEKYAGNQQILMWDVEE